MAGRGSRYHGKPGLQIILAFAVGVAAFALAALVSPPLRELDAEALFVLGVFILVSLFVAETAARAGRRADASEQARGLLADEQAGLRRVATLVARAVPPEEVFAAVTEEVERLIPVESVAYAPWGVAAGDGRRLGGRPRQDGLIPSEQLHFAREGAQTSFYAQCGDS